MAQDSTQHPRSAEDEGVPDAGTATTRSAGYGHAPLGSVAPAPAQNLPATTGGVSPAATGGPGGWGGPVGLGPVGQVRGTGFGILMTIVTFGIYPLYWYFQAHEEMKRHTGAGVGGALALVLAFFAGLASPYVTSSEVGGLWARSGRPAPVSAATGFWYFPGMFILVGPLVWWVKTNGALNEYWRSVGAR